MKIDTFFPPSRSRPARREEGGGGREEGGGGSEEGGGRRELARRVVLVGVLLVGLLDEVALAPDGLVPQQSVAHLPTLPLMPPAHGHAESEEGGGGRRRKEEGGRRKEEGRRREKEERRKEEERRRTTKRRGSPFFIYTNSRSTANAARCYIIYNI